MPDMVIWLVLIMDRPDIEQVPNRLVIREHSYLGVGN